MCLLLSFTKFVTFKELQFKINLILHLTRYLCQKSSTDFQPYLESLNQLMWNGLQKLFCCKQISQYTQEKILRKMRTSSGICVKPFNLGDTVVEKNRMALFLRLQRQVLHL